MFYKLGKRIFRFFIDLIQFIRLVLVFLSFAIILFWLLQLGGATFLGPVTPFFESIKSTTHLFYNRMVAIDGMAVDFSYLIATFVIMAIIWGLKFLVEYIEMFENKYDNIYRYLKQKAEDLFNLGLEKQYLLSEYKNNKLLLLVNFDAKNLLKDSFYHNDVSVGVGEQQKKILMEFSENLGENFHCQKKFLNDGLLIYISSLGDVDKIILCIETILKRLRQKYLAEKWQIDSLVCVEVYANENEVIPKIRNLIMLIRLGLRNKMVCLASFKQRYLLQKKPKYTVEANGVYTINDTEEDVYCLKYQK